MKRSAFLKMSAPAGAAGAALTGLPFKAAAQNGDKTPSLVKPGTKFVSGSCISDCGSRCLLIHHAENGVVIRAETDAIADSIRRIRAQYGNEAFYMHHGMGLGDSAVNGSWCTVSPWARLMSLYGGYLDLGIIFRALYTVLYQPPDRKRVRTFIRCASFDDFFRVTGSAIGQEAFVRLRVQ